MSDLQSHNLLSNIIFSFYIDNTERCPDILSIASAISIDVDLPDLAACLEVSLDDVDKTGTKTDQIVKLFLHWQSKDCAKNSKAMLIECLRQLKVASVDKILKEYGQ